MQGRALRVRLSPIVGCPIKRGEYLRRIREDFRKDRRGHILVEAMIALVVVGAVTYHIINNDIMPGLKTKWDMMNNTIQNSWIN